MQGLSKATWVALGYAAAFGLACMAMAAHQAILDPADPQASGGMQAFGDLLLFVGVFGVASLLPTGLALYWLRQHQGFWQAISSLGLLLALTGVAAALLHAVGRHVAPHSVLGALAAFSVLRLLLSPLCALALGLGSLLTAFTAQRRLLLLATALELLACAYIAVAWVMPLLLQRH